MKITAPDIEPIALSKAWVGQIDGEAEALAEIDGRICRIETKESLLEIGVAFCAPVDGNFDDWPHTVGVLDELSGTEQILWSHTTDGGVVAAARRWQQLNESGDFELGQTLL